MKTKLPFIFRGPIYIRPCGRGICLGPSLEALDEALERHFGGNLLANARLEISLLEIKPARKARKRK